GRSGAGALRLATLPFPRRYWGRRCRRRTWRSCRKCGRRWPVTIPTIIPVSFIDPAVIYEDEFIPDHAGETSRGYDAMERAWTQALEAFDEAVPFDNSIVWAGDAGDEVVTCHHVRGRGKGSGIPIEFDYAYLWRLRKGRVIYCKSFRDAESALEAAALQE